MPPGNLLVLLLGGGTDTRLERAIAERDDGAASVRVVVPARVGPLDWLATDEDAARAEAEARALTAEWLLTGELEIEAEAGDVDPAQAVEDALQSFPADEILLVAGRGDDGALERSLRRFGLPVTRIGDSPPRGEPSRLRTAFRGLAAGRSKLTPFVLFAAVNLVLLAVAAVITLVALLVLWLL